MKKQLTKEQLLEKKEQLTEEIKALTLVIEASNTPVFELLVREVKKEMENNIAEEDFKALKNNQKKIESYRSIEKIIQNQADLLESKQDELDDVEENLKCYQPSLFEGQDETDPEDTGFQTSNMPLVTGDIFSIEGELNELHFMLVKKSIEIKDSFAIISNFFEGERCLQYPANLELLEGADYEGNIYDASTEQEKALEYAKIIADYQEMMSNPCETEELNSEAENHKPEPSSENDELTEDEIPY